MIAADWPRIVTLEQWQTAQAGSRARLHLTGAHLGSGRLDTLPAPYLRKTFAVSKPVRSATVHATALGLYELRHDPDTSVGTIIDEAVELAKRYSTEKSGRFVNGVLATLAGLERP